MIASNKYPQFHDYLSQLMNFPESEIPQKITQALIGRNLEVDPSGISKFLGGSVKKPKKSLDNFIIKYPLEYNKWPKGSDKIERVLEASDVFYFLGQTEDPSKKNVNDLSSIINSSSETSLSQIVQQPIIDPPQPKMMPLKNVTLSIKSTLRINQVQSINKNLKTTLSMAPIAISYRGHLNENDGKGMLYDHMTLQRITQFPTSSVVPNNTKVAELVQSHFTNVLKNHTAQLLFGSMDSNEKISPPFVETCNHLGLLLIPGRVRKVENEVVRLNHEYHLIRGALNRGQPILALCAGAWRLFEQLCIWSMCPDKLNQDPSTILKNIHEQNSTLIDVKDHTFNGGMLRLKNDGVNVGWNAQIHDIEIQPNTYLKMAMKEETRLPVNSVHWKAINHSRIPVNTRISAVAKESDTLSVNSRKGELMKPEENIAEAFENVSGAPFMGIQWHPEGYGKNNPHASLLKFMAKAGNTYALKTKMHVELKNKQHPQN